MIDQLLAGYTGRNAAEIAELMNHPSREIHAMKAYKSMIEAIDVETLSKTMAKARHYMDENLPSLVKHYRKKYELEEFPLSGYMVCNWVMAYVKTPDTLPELLNTHTNVPVEIMRDALPDILEMLGNVPENAEHWQKAFSTVVIPLIA